jgi:protein MPE1
VRVDKVEFQTAFLFLSDPFMSVVYYKFKSSKDHDHITFDGTAISVFDLKRDIIMAKKLGKGTDFDLALYNPHNNQEYKDDHALIPRSSSVLVRRLPAHVGKGSAQKYINNVMGLSDAALASRTALPMKRYHQ